MWGKWSHWWCQRGIATWIAIIFKIERLEGRAGVGLEFMHPTQNYLWHVKANNIVLLQSMWSDLVGYIRQFGLRFWILRDRAGEVIVDCSMATAIAATFAILLVMTPLDATLAVIDPWDGDQITFLENQGMTFFRVILSLKECTVYTLEKEIRHRDVLPQEKVC